MLISVRYEILSYLQFNNASSEWKLLKNIFASTFSVWKRRLNIQASQQQLCKQQ
jgi:hypothetical protein